MVDGVLELIGAPDEPDDDVVAIALDGGVPPLAIGTDDPAVPEPASIAPLAGVEPVAVLLASGAMAPPLAGVVIAELSVGAVAVVVVVVEVSSAFLPQAATLSAAVMASRLIAVRMENLSGC